MIPAFYSRYPIFPGSLRSQPAVHHLSLWILTGRLRSRLNPMDNSIFRPSVASRIDRRFPLRLSAHQHSHAVTQGFEILLLSHHRNCSRSFPSRCRIHVEILSRFVAGRGNCSGAWT